MKLFKRPYTEYLLLLLSAFAAQLLQRAVILSWGCGLMTMAWLFIYLRLTARFRKVWQLALTGAVFVAGFYTGYANALGSAWLDLLVFIPCGSALYGFLLLYAFIKSSRRHIMSTLFFPLLWMLAYFIATLLKVPIVARFDMMLTDMSVIIQSEAVIGSAPMSFMIMWALALMSHACDVKKPFPAALGLCLIGILAFTGCAVLFPNLSDAETVKVAYALTPYGGDFMNYTPMSFEEYTAFIHASAAEARAQGAEILVFNEETCDITDTRTEEFLEECARAASENDLHMLVGLDIVDTDNSHGGNTLNVLYWLDRSGRVAAFYQKTNLIPIVEAGYVPGNGNIPSFEIEVSSGTLKVACLICYDSNFPDYIRNIDRDTDILFLPSWDWSAITDIHTRVCTAVAVSNGVNLFKVTYDGITLAVDKYGTEFYRASSGDTGFGNVITIDMPCGYTDETAALITDSSTAAMIAAEIMAMCVCIILLATSASTHMEKSRRNMLFRLLVITNIAALASDSLSWILDGHNRLYPMLFFSTLLSLILTFALSGVFVFYITEVIREHEPLSGRAARVIGILCLAAAAVTTAGCISGDLFVFDDGCYSTGRYYGFYLALDTLAVLIIGGYVFRYRKALQHTNLLASYLYLSIPGIATVINIAAPDMALAYPAITLSLMILYILIQTDTVSRLESLERETSYNSLHDELTGLSNRRAYEEKLRQLASSDRRLGVVFCDMNGLKYANDHFGHASGDQRIIRFTDLLCRYFRREEVFRISGDEFVILLPDIDSEPFTLRMQLLKNAVNAEDIPLACTGSAFGTSTGVMTLISRAESQMYTSKEKFHKAHPELAR